jgi:uncharacterized Rmd1/YagE family protein
VSDISSHPKYTPRPPSTPSHPDPPKIPGGKSERKEKKTMKYITYYNTARGYDIAELNEYDAMQQMTHPGLLKYIEPNESYMMYPEFFGNPDYTKESY